MSEHFTITNAGTLDTAVLSLLVDVTQKGGIVEMEGSSHLKLIENATPINFEEPTQILSDEMRDQGFIAGEMCLF